MDSLLKLLEKKRITETDVQLYQLVDTFLKNYPPSLEKRMMMGSKFNQILWKRNAAAISEFLLYKFFEVLCLMERSSDMCVYVCARAHVLVSRVCSLCLNSCWLIKWCILTKKNKNQRLWLNHEIIRYVWSAWYMGVRQRNALLHPMPCLRRSRILTHCMVKPWFAF